MTRHAGIPALLILAALAVAAPARADLSDRLGALSGDNARGYLGPLPDALSGTLNSAIFQTGRVPKAKPSITIGVHVMGVSFKDADRTFIPTDPAGFQSTTPTPVSTIIGSTQSTAVQGQGGLVLNYPGGFDVSTFAIAAPELTVGSFLGTRAVVRYISATLGDSDYGKLELFGIGGQHSISQYLPGLPVDLAVGAFYQTFKLGNGLLDTKAFHAEITGSRSFGMIQPYAGLGFDTFKMDVAYTSSTDPGTHIAFSMPDRSNVHLTLGAQLSMPFVQLHGEFDAAANVGAAIGLRLGL